MVNEGTLDAMVNNIVKIPDLTETQAKYLNYSITHENGYIWEYNLYYSKHQENGVGDTEYIQAGGRYYI